MTTEKPSENEKIELARQSGYNEACCICQKEFEKLKSNFKEDGFLHNDYFDEMFDKVFRGFKEEIK